MRRQTIATLLGAAALASLPFVPDPNGMVIRVFAGSYLIAMALLHLSASVPVRYPVGLLRLASLAVSGAILREIMVTPLGSRSELFIYIAGYCIFATFMLAVGPMASVPFRRRAYGTLLNLGWLLPASRLLSGQLGDGDGSVFFVWGPVFILGAALAAFKYWKLSGRSFLVDMLERWQGETREFVRHMQQPVKGWNLRERWDRFALATVLLGINDEALRTDHGYKKVLDACRTHPHTAVSWKVAYASALARQDFQEAVRIVNEARSYGFERVLGYRALAIALRESSDPMWRAVLRRGWERAQEEQTAWSEAEYFDVSGDPTKAWREEDSLFARLHRQGTLGSQWVPPVSLEARG